MIVIAAIQFKGVSYTGVRHCEIFNDLTRLGHYKRDLIKARYIQGFVNDKNEFKNREEAKKEVIACGQRYSPCSSTLTSEDLW